MPGLQVGGGNLKTNPGASHVWGISGRSALAPPAGPPSWSSMFTLKTLSAKSRGKIMQGPTPANSYRCDVVRAGNFVNVGKGDWAAVASQAVGDHTGVGTIYRVRNHYTQTRPCALPGWHFLHRWKPHTKKFRVPVIVDHNRGDRSATSPYRLWARWA
jgi:hypothetical protein